MTSGISGEKQVITFSNTSNSVSSLFTLSKRDDDFSTVRVSTSFRSLTSLIFPQKIYYLLCRLPLSIISCHYRLQDLNFLSLWQWNLVSGFQLLAMSGRPVSLSCISDSKASKIFPDSFWLPCKIDLVTVFGAILTSRQTREKLQCLCDDLLSNNFRRTAVL